LRLHHFGGVFAILHLAARAATDWAIRIFVGA